ncbi:HTH-type transcriptional repressor RghR [Peptococcaceae bacterium CEB3]|nr:HTH-type transcriptional repressor RghR [Peptococcaceae bacterium CEB3]
MREKEISSDLGSLLKALLKEKSLSMRKLSQLSGIETATISRIVNGKQQARPKHLQQFAQVLSVPVERLFEAAGYGIKAQKKDPYSDFRTSLEAIQEVLLASKLFDEEYTRERVEQRLADYEHYARTEEGQRIILEDFQEKIKQVGGLGPFIDDLNQLYALYLQTDVTSPKRAVLGSALLYFILATDIIPDYVFPIGYLDDAIAIKLVLQKLSLGQDRDEGAENEP